MIEPIAILLGALSMSVGVLIGLVLAEILDREGPDL